MRNRKCDYKAR